MRVYVTTGWDYEKRVVLEVFVNESDAKKYKASWNYHAGFVYLGEQKFRGIDIEPRTLRTGVLNVA